MKKNYSIFIKEGFLLQHKENPIFPCSILFTKENFQKKTNIFLPEAREAIHPRHQVPVDRVDPISDRNLDREVVLAVDPENCNFKLELKSRR